MYTYDVVSESVRNPHELAAELTRRSGDGWEIVQITYDGAAWFHAFIRHAGSVSVAPYPGMKATASNATTPVATVSASSPLGGPLSDAAKAPSPTASNTSASSPNVPANWYPDPSKRYELRYWNGSAWTAHVATGGVQSTDEPK
ncbi:unannotated protein [freshwater metagenome]|uniref:Unannotated protein n=1 Tax=freshwater metagenome TaxID=449393 RepID=A0A6J6HUM6_9ZZZZ